MRQPDACMYVSDSFFEKTIIMIVMLQNNACGRAKEAYAPAHWLRDDEAGKVAKESSEHGSRTLQLKQPSGEIQVYA